MLVFGASNTRMGGLALPLALATLGMPGCELFVSLDLALPVPNPAGWARFQTTLPNNAALLGGTFHNQCVAVSPGTNPANLIVSNAGTGRIGR